MKAHANGLGSGFFALAMAILTVGWVPPWMTYVAFFAGAFSMGYFTGRMLSKQEDSHA